MIRLEKLHSGRHTGIKPDFGNLSDLLPTPFLELLNDLIETGLSFG